MSVRYNDNGTEYIIAGIGGEVLPVGTIVDYDGTNIPDGWALYSDETYFNVNSYRVLVTTPSSTITVPANYLVGKNTLDVYLDGAKLICTSSTDTSGLNGHYYEVGNANTISNTIHITSDWSLTAGQVFEFVIRGTY